MKSLRSLIITLVLVAWAGLGATAWAAELRILYVNDFHGFAQPDKSPGSQEMLGGVAYLAGEVAKLRRGKPTLLLAAGDMIQGANWANLSQGKSSMELMNVLGFDALVVGNHEFDYGPQVLNQRISQAKFPVLAANVEGLPGLKPYVIKTVGGLKVGLIGVVTADTPVATHPRNVAGLKFISPEAAVTKYLPEVRSQADLIVVLSHEGLEADKALAANVPGIDVIVGGHSHTKLLKPVRVGPTIIVQAWEHAKALGVLDLTVAGGKITASDGYLKEIKPVPGREDPKIQRIVRRYSQQVDSLLGRTVARTEVDLDGETQHVRSRETNLGDLIADILREKAGGAAAIINGGGIRTSIPRGKITVKQVYAALPFDSYLVAIRLTGRQVKDALEHGVAALEEPAGRFPQVSGLAFTYSRSAPVGSRVKEVTLGGRPLEPDQEYVIATNDFLAAGGDGFQSFGDAIRAPGDYSNLGGALTSRNLVYNDPGTWLRDLVIDYLKAKKQVAPKVEGRIKEVD
jgi:2',3'-cyclic-nucleotide 2'-phosphodiesterase (5'-nucleotidase family)